MIQWRYDWRESMKNKRSSVTLIFNKQGELALQKRAAHDTSYPSHWDFSAAGGIDEDEDPSDAAVRELKEELGIEGSPAFVGEYLYKNESTQDRLYVYRMTYDGSFSPDANEVQEVKFFSLEQISAMLASDEKFHPEFQFLWNRGIIKWHDSARNGIESKVLS